MKSPIILLFFTLSLLYACSDELLNPDNKGEISGYAYCFDEFGNKPADFSGIQVFTEPGRELSAVTNADGRYVLNDVNYGTIVLSYEKEGFGTMKLFGINHHSKKTNMAEYYYGGPAPFIYQNIKTQIDSLYLIDKTLWANVSHPELIKPDYLDMRFFFSTEKNFNTNDADAVQDFALMLNGENYCRWIIIELEALPFNQGETVFLKACIYTEVSEILLSNDVVIHGIDSYYDSDTNINQYPNMSNASAEFSFVMP